ncbi:uncharacterized protein P884DRAFT_253006 [Thermothelomyces heterothallicus CBS 202.75]|uniref:uncharacterized protein n=1 Tax=Thermothelomyces heterothallicus CBS 202.75 TaxID=1149848 RepID=UPI003743284E
MPRPKRSRVGATRPTGAPSPAPDGQAAEKAPTVAPAEVPGSDIYDVSDREKERINQRVAQAAKADSHSRRTRASAHLDLNSEQAKALEDSRRRRDDAMDRLDDLTSTSRPNCSDSPDIEHSRRESVSEPQRRLTDASGLDLDDDIFANLDDSLDDTANSFDETRTGYRSGDTSSINVAMFKRRPRQSSVAGRDDAPIRPSSRGQNTPSISTTLNFSNFKRRAREPSILGTGRKPRRARSQSVASQASRNPSVLGDGDDSGPDGESTPLDKTRRRTRASLVAASGPGAESPALPPRKRKSLESHDGRGKRPAAEPEAEEPGPGPGPGPEPEPEIIHQSIEVEVEVERTPSPPRGRARERERFSTPVAAADDPDMAPPLSSSSEGDSPIAWPPLDTLAHRTYNTRKPPPRALKTPELMDSSSDLSSPPSLTYSPHYVAPPKGPPRKQAAPPPKITTADLTSLLPRRRHKASNLRTGGDDPFDPDASDDDRYVAASNGEDDVSYVDSRAAARRRKGQMALGRSTSNRRAAKAATKPGNAGGKGRAIRTYGAANEDKENEEIQDEIVVASGDEQGGGEDEQDALPEEETTRMMAERLGEELQKAAKKFKEVDEWELSFEEVTHSSSPGPDAR